MMRCYLLISALATCFLIQSVRDPFSYTDGYHSLCCVSIGSLNNEFFARVFNDGRLSTVRLHERYCEYYVTALTAESITLKDSSGMSHLLVLARENTHKKKPFNFKKLKG